MSSVRLVPSIHTLPLVSVVEPGQAVHQGALARAGGAHDGGELARREVDGDAGEGVDGGVALAVGLPGVDGPGGDGGVRSGGRRRRGVVMVMPPSWRTRVRPVVGRSARTRRSLTRAGVRWAVASAHAPGDGEAVSEQHEGSAGPGGRRGVRRGRLPVGHGGGRLRRRRVHPGRLLQQLREQGRAVPRPVGRAGRPHRGHGGSRRAGRPTTAPDPRPRLLDAVAGEELYDRQWFLLNTEFLLHAMRSPEAAACLVAHRERLRAGIGELVAAFLETEALAPPPASTSRG